jgi:cytochrome c oxidase cbb3-type subunit III
MSSRKDGDESEVKKTGHIYDGIEELDHPVPNWFRALFYFTIAVGIVYFFHYTLGEGPTLTNEYRTAKDAEEYALYERQAKNGGAKAFSEDELRVLVNDTAKKTLGATAFQVKCATCHGAQGQGGIGPNLTDPYWLHGGKMTEIIATISQGVPDKGMPPWGPILSGEEIQALTVYVRILSGTKPAGAKAPQGTLIKSEL